MLNRVAAHESAAWTAFERRYGPIILAYALRLGLHLQDAEDVRQDVLASLVRSMPSFSYDPSVGRFRDYVRRIVRNAVFRRTARHGPRFIALCDDDGALFAAPLDDLDAEWETQWRRYHCERAMLTLMRTESDKNLEVFRLFLAGADAASIATALNLAPENVRKIKQRLRERLESIVRAQLLEKDGDDTPVGSV